MKTNDVPPDADANETFFTGPMANALNSVVGNGCCVLHQSCLGVGTAHSDLSATRITASSWPKTLTVVEGKWKINDNLCVVKLSMNCFVTTRLTEVERRGTTGEFFSLPLTQRNVESDLAFILIIVADFLRILHDKTYSGLYGWYGCVSFQCLKRNWILGLLKVAYSGTID